MAEVEATIQRISGYPGVLGCIVVASGKLLKSTLPDQATADELMRVAPMLTEVCRAAVREMDPQNDLEIIRLRTTKHQEVMVVYNEAYLVIALQDTKLPQHA